MYDRHESIPVVMSVGAKIRYALAASYVGGVTAVLVLVPMVQLALKAALAPCIGSGQMGQLSG
jgi:hypothetical protein